MKPDDVSLMPSVMDMECGDSTSSCVAARSETTPTHAN